MTEILAGSKSESFTPDNLMFGEKTTNSYTAPIGFTCKRGEVVCFENNKLVKLIEAKKALAFGVMVHTQTDALAAETKLSIYKTGMANSDELELNGVALADITEPLARSGLLIREFGA